MENPANQAIGVRQYLLISLFLCPCGYPAIAEALFLEKKEPSTFAQETYETFCLKCGAQTKRVGVDRVLPVWVEWTAGKDLVNHISNT